MKRLLKFSIALFILLLGTYAGAAETIYDITEDAVSYTAEKNHYGDEAGTVQFRFVAPKDGFFRIQVEPSYNIALYLQKSVKTVDSLNNKTYTTLLEKSAKNFADIQKNKGDTTIFFVEVLDKEMYDDDFTINYTYRETVKGAIEITSTPEWYLAPGYSHNRKNFFMVAPEDGYYHLSVTSPYNNVNLYASEGASFTNKTIVYLNKGDTTHIEVYTFNDDYINEPFNVQYYKLVNLTTHVTGDGYISKEGSPYEYATQLYAQGKRLAILAYHDFVYEFTSWSVDSGNCTIEDKYSARTYINLDDNCQLTANFKESEFKDLSTTKQTGVRGWYKFTLPDSGCYQVDFQASGIYTIFLMNKTGGGFSQNLDTLQQLECGNKGDGRQYYLYPLADEHFYTDADTSYTIFYSKAQVIFTQEKLGTARATLGKTYKDGDKIPITAYPTFPYVFDKWEVITEPFNYTNHSNYFNDINERPLNPGKCTIDNIYSQSTNVTFKGTCVIKPHFKLRPVYNVTHNGKKYSIKDSTYKGTPGFAFHFKAPEEKCYALFVNPENYGLDIYTFVDSTFTDGIVVKSFSEWQDFCYQKGEERFFAVTPQKVGYTDTCNVHYESEYSLAVESYHNENASVSPTRNFYRESDNVGIVTMGSFDLKFDKWETVEGNCAIENPSAGYTKISPTDNCVFRAYFLPGTVHTLTSTEKTYNFLEDKAAPKVDEIRYKWNPPDTGWYYIVVNSVNLDDITFTEYDDSYFTIPRFVQTTDDNKKYLVKGSSSTKYFGIDVNSGLQLPNKDFSIYVEKVNSGTLVVSSNQGTVEPDGRWHLPFGEKTTVTAKPSSGYLFNKWEITRGSCTISDKSNATTTITLTSSECYVKAKYIVDPDAEPVIAFNGFNENRFPTICTDVTVGDFSADENIIGIDTSAFSFSLNGKQIKPQYNFTQDNIDNGKAIAIVVDISHSMGKKSSFYTSTRLEKAQKIITEFINAMPDNYQMSITSDYTDSSSYQPLTNDKKKLIKAVEKLSTFEYFRFSDAIEYAYKDLTSFKGFKEIIAISDDENVSWVGANVLDIFKIYDIVYNQIDIEPSDDLSFNDVIDQTGGFYVFAKTLNDINTIYSDTTYDKPKQQKYSFCFDATDNVKNGDEYDITLNVNFGTKSATKSIHWVEQKNFEQDKPDTIIVRAADSSKVIRTTEQLRLAIRTQEFEDSSYTQTINISCLATGDKERFLLSNRGNGLFELDSLIQKRESLTPTLSNNILECANTDTIVSVFVDPVYSKITRDTVIFTDGPQIAYEFFNEDFSAKPDSINKKSTPFGFRVTLLDSVPYQSDSMAFQLFTDTGDTLPVVLTRKSKNVFETTGEFQFVLSAASKKQGTLDAIINTKTQVNSAVIYASTKQDNVIISNKDSLVVWAVYKNVYDKITLSAADSGAITRTTEKIRIGLHTQDFYEKNTQTVRVWCLASQDYEAYTLNDKGKGIFETDTLVQLKESDKAARNNILECTAADTIVTEFYDDIYNTATRDTTLLRDDVEITYQFMKKDFSAALDSINDYRVTFGISVTAFSPSVSKVDTISVLLFTDKGDSLQVKATETGAFTSVYESTVDFRFISDPAQKKSSELASVLDHEQFMNRVAIHAQVNRDKSKLEERDSLVAWVETTPADSAEIYDNDKDGRADFIRVHFARAMEDDSITIDTIAWSTIKVSGPDLFAKKPKFDKKRRWLEAELKEPFQYGLTNGGSSYLKISHTLNPIVQKIKLKDKVGAVPLTAIKHPGKEPPEDIMGVEKLPPFDTLVVSMSEPIKETEEKAWKNAFNLSNDCGSADTWKLSIKAEPRINSEGRVWRIIIPREIDMTAGSCLSMNPDADYTDNAGNTLGIGGTVITGNDAKRHIFEIYSTPTIAGSSKKAQWVSPETMTWEEIPDTMSCIRIETRMAYNIDFMIYDQNAQVVSEQSSKFGYDGELRENIRRNPDNGAKANFVCWDQHSKDGRKVAAGVYLWKVWLRFEDGHKELRIIKSGIKRVNRD